MRYINCKVVDYGKVVYFNQVKLSDLIVTNVLGICNVDRAYIHIMENATVDSKFYILIIYESRV